MGSTRASLFQRTGCKRSQTSRPCSGFRFQKAVGCPRSAHLVFSASDGLSSSDRPRKGDSYNKEMAEKMKWGDRPYEYNFERGLYYHEIVKNLICGSQPTRPEDVISLKETESVDAIVCLQQRHDALYWKVDPDAIERTAIAADMLYTRKQMKDFDKESLRRTLPEAVQLIAEHMGDGKRVYVHCTAGLGRAPATCIAYLYWFCDYDLDSAYQYLTSIRPCGPSRDAVRGATYDLLSGGDWDAFAALPQHAYTTLESSDRHTLQYRVLKR